MKKIYISFLLLLSICCISPTLAQSVAPAPYYSMTNWDTSPYKSFRFTSQRSSYEWINFRMLHPNGYDSLATDNKKYPVIIMLHGAGESGRMEWNNTTKKNTPYPEDDPRIDNNDHQLLYGAKEHLAAVQNGRFPGFVIFPQNFYGSWVSGNGSASSSLHKDLLKVTEMIDYLITELKIDPARIYVHGLSNGAAGTWYAAYNRPDLFAAALPMSAPGDPAMAEKLKTVPLWVFQGELDTNPRPFSTLLTVDAVRNAGGTVRYLEYAGTGHNTWNKAYREADFFEWMLSQRKGGGEVPNQPPVVDAGTDKAITLPTNTASFTATASDPDGSVGSYLWEKVSGPAATLSGTSTATLSLSNLVEGSYTFKVTVTDNEGASALDEVNLTVMPASGTSCQALAFDGSNKLSLSAPIVLSGDFTIEYWAKFSAGITNADAPLSGGSNQFINYYNAQARIYSNGASGGHDPIVSSHKTQAGAWTHYAFVRQGSSMKIYINGVEDTGAKTTGQWTGNFTINNLGQGYNGFFNGEIDELRLWNEARSGTAIAENFEKGVAVSSSALTAYYTFEEQSGVVVDRTSNGFDSQSLPAGIIRANSTAPLTDCEGEGEPAPNQPPVANAGTDKAITLPTNTASFTATASDPDGTIASWLWEKMSGPTASMDGTSTATLSLSNLTEGSYTFKVTVTDNEGATAADQVNLTVNAATAGNQPPVVDAGTDKAITLPENSTSFTSTASDSDGSVDSYLWEKISGPAATLSGTSTATLSLSNLVEGSYTFKVTVTDNLGATATDEVNLAVNPGSDGNQVPVANAGSDKTLTLPTNAISLSGTAYDSDGRFVAFKWEKVSGPSVTMSGQNTANVKLSALVEGVYVFRFSATDDGGATGTDEMTLTVKPAEETVQSSTSAARVSDSSTPTVNAYPNTFTNHLNIALSAEEPNLYHIKMVDLSGKTVYTSSLQTAMTEAAVYQGVHRIELEKAPLQQGMYILLVEAQDGSFKKVMKVFRGR